MNSKKPNLYHVKPCQHFCCLCHDHCAPNCEIPFELFVIVLCFCHGWYVRGLVLHPHHVLVVVVVVVVEVVVVAHLVAVVMAIVVVEVVVYLEVEVLAQPHAARAGLRVVYLEVDVLAQPHAARAGLRPHCKRIYPIQTKQDLLRSLPQLCTTRCLHLF